MSPILAALFALAAPDLPAPAAPPARMLALDEALRTAAERAPQLRAARAQIRLGTARIEQARSAYYPRVDGNAQYQRTTSNSILPPSLASSPLAATLKVDNKLSPADTLNYYLFGVTATVPLWDFGKTKGLVDVARAQASVSGADLDGAVETSELAVRVAYFTALAAKELVGVGEKALANQAGHVKQVREFVSAGTRPKIDLASADLNLEQARLTLVRARNGFELAKLQLNQAMGVEGDTAYDVVLPAETVPPEEATPIGTLLDDAVRRRPELARIEAQLAGSRAQKAQANAGYYPNLFAQGNFSGAKVSDFDTGMNWYVALGLTWNFFGGFQTRAQLAEADAAAEALAAQREQLRQGVRAELQQQQLAISEAKERLVVASRAVTTAEERLRLAEGRYKAGAGTILELDDAQISSANVEAQRVQANYDLQIARARLVRAVGRSKP